MKTKLKIDLYKEDNLDNYRFINMLSEAKWQKLINTYKDPANVKPLEELLTELVEDIRS